MTGSHPSPEQARPDLSIVAIIALFDGARWIEGAIRSVFAQTVQPDEFIVVDDGSTDDGPAIVERLARERPITLLRRSNGGQSTARNVGVAHSKGALIAFLDHDDRWHSNHLEVLRRAFAEHRGMTLGWAYSDFDDIEGNGLLVDKSFAPARVVENPKRHLLTLLSQGILIPPSATLISRAAFEAVGGFDEHLCGYEDDDLFLRIFRANYDNAYIPCSTSQWRIHSSSCGASDRNDDSLRYYVKKLLASYPDDPWRDRCYARSAIAPRFIKIWILMYIRASRYGNYGKMRQYIKDAFALIPHLGLKQRIFYTITLSMMRIPGLRTALLTMYGVMHHRA